MTRIDENQHGHCCNLHSNICVALHACRVSAALCGKWSSCLLAAPSSSGSDCNSQKVHHGGQPDIPDPKGTTGHLLGAAGMQVPVSHCRQGPAMEGTADNLRVRTLWGTLGLAKPLPVHLTMHQIRGKEIAEEGGC